MKEQLISFETAKLAKKKGFDSTNPDMFYYYHKKGKQVEDGWDSNAMAAPTQSLLQKWLREEHNLHLVVDYFEPDKSFHFTMYGINKVEQCDSSNSYEEALEKGLLEALYNINIRYENTKTER